ncbi:MAG TPA: right-handed parallel beta-helix repeat-containing protein [Candidatus Limnocylindrales bacterium]|nr:right-handed parallel beta-helix repeat-containing protein [Candidatus Limnocylindrales bacterium]
MGLCLAVIVGVAVHAAENATLDSGNHVFNITSFGAKGDGVTLNTRSINDAIGACSAAGGGQVLIPPGRFVSGTIHLRSHITLFLAAGATLVGTTNLDAYQQPEIPSFMPEAKWGKWHRALIVGENVEDVRFAGPGLIDGNRVFDPTGEEHMRGPHTIVFVNCHGFSFRDLSILDAANYAIFFQASDDVEVRDVKITGGWDGIHFRGAPGRWCHNVKILHCQFYTGDDSIAGRYWDNVLVSGCVVNSSCNGIRLIGPATHLIVHDCVFYGPGERPHRTGGRTNMLSGIILQPGAWDRTEGLLDNVLLANNTMHEVASPVTIWTKPGNPVGTITIAGLEATEVYRSAFSVESWADAPITNVVLRNAHIEFSGGGTAEQAKQVVKGPGVDARALPAWGIYARNVERLTVQDVRFSVAGGDQRPVVLADRVSRLTFDAFKFTRVPAVAEPMALTNVGQVEVDGTAK